MFFSQATIIDNHQTPQLEVVPSGERLRRKDRHGVFAGKTV